VSLLGICDNLPHFTPFIYGFVLFILCQAQKKRFPLKMNRFGRQCLPRGGNLHGTAAMADNSVWR
jgi:hypothetical protein